MAVAPEISRRHNPTANSLILWLLKSLCLFFPKDPQALGMEVCFVDVSVETGLQRFFSMVSIFAKKGFLDQRVEPHLSEYIKTKDQNAVKDYAGLIK